MFYFNELTSRQHIVCISHSDGSSNTEGCPFTTGHNLIYIKNDKNFLMATHLTWAHWSTSRGAEIVYSTETLNACRLTLIQFRNIKNQYKYHQCLNLKSIHDLMLLIEIYCEVL